MPQVRTGRGGVDRRGQDPELQSGRDAAVEVRPAAQLLPQTMTMFPAIITGYTRQTTNVYAYSWVEADVIDGVYSERANGRTSTVDADMFGNPAYNGVEQANDGADIESGGVNVQGPSYPTGFFLQPLRMGAWPSPEDGDPGVTDSWPASQGIGVMLLEVPSALAGDDPSLVIVGGLMNQHDGDCDTSPMNWRGSWELGQTYAPDDVAWEPGWMGVALTSTSDHVAPQPSGDPFWVSGLGDTPAWSTPSVAAAQIIRGQRYTFANSGYFTSMRVWVDAVDPNLRYEVWAINDPLGATPLAQRIIAFNPTATGWQTIPLGAPRLVIAGTTSDIYVSKTNTNAPTPFSGDWNYVQQQPDPVAGQIAHRNNFEMRIHKTDANAVDRTVDLATVIPGTTITAGGQEWSVTAILGNTATILTLEVAPQVRIPSALYTFDFAVPVSVAIPWVEITDHFVSQPLVRGFRSDSGYANIVLDDDAYGVDIAVQEAAVSGDWDLMPLGDSAIGGGALGQGEAVLALEIGALIDRIETLEGVMQSTLGSDWRTM